MDTFNFNTEAILKERPWLRTFLKTKWQIKKGCVKRVDADLLDGCSGNRYLRGKVYYSDSTPDVWDNARSFDECDLFDACGNWLCQIGARTSYKERGFWERVLRKAPEEIREYFEERVSDAIKNCTNRGAPACYVVALDPFNFILFRPARGYTLMDVISAKEKRAAEELATVESNIELMSSESP